jgi:methylmalonyl-CoA/ethylmalonyl-CoA epimerase
MLEAKYKRIDHMAIAVNDLEKAIHHYHRIMGMTLLERRETSGKNTAMISAVMDAGSFTIVLIQGFGEQSQVSRYIANFGQGVQHVAFEVDDIEHAIEQLITDGVEFSTSLLVSSGLKQIFTKRDKESGMMYEFIERTGEQGFTDNNVNRLFAQLEQNDQF